MPLKISFYVAIWKSNFLSKAFPQCYKQTNRSHPHPTPTPTKMSLGLPGGAQLPAQTVVLSQVPGGCRPSDACSRLPPHPQVTLDLQSSGEKFGGFLRSALDVLSQILELATLQDIGKVCVSCLLIEPWLPRLKCTSAPGALEWEPTMLAHLGSREQVLQSGHLSLIFILASR